MDEAYQKYGIRMKKVWRHSFFVQAPREWHVSMDGAAVIVLNDINLSTRMGGGREHFDALLQKIPDSEYRQYHFNNNNRSNHFHYGIEYETNELILAPSEILRDYEPFDSCASAQLIIKRVME